MFYYRFQQLRGSSSVIYAERYIFCKRVIYLHWKDC